MTLTFFFSMFCSLPGISLSWKTLVFGRITSHVRTNVHRTAFFLHIPDFSFSKVTALKVIWGKDTSRRSKEPGSDLPSCFSAWAPFCKCGWRHHISRSGCGPDCCWIMHISNVDYYINRWSLDGFYCWCNKKNVELQIGCWCWYGDSDSLNFAPFRLP